MKRITRVPDAPAFDLFGDPILDEKGKQLVITQRAFLLGRIVDAKFIEGRANAIEAAVLVLRTYERVEAELKKEQEYIELEDEQHARLLKSTEEPTGGYVLQVQHCLVPYLIAVRDATDAK